jgi:hypothetical protein
LCLLLAATPLLAGDVESWNGVEVEAVSTPKFLVRLRGEIRSSNTFRTFLQARGAADVRWFAAPHLSVVTNTQVVEGKSSLGKWEESNRFLAGIELPFQKEKVTFTGRSAVEHLFLPYRLGYNRFRERAGVRFTRWRIQPQLMAELFLDSQGWATTRPSVTALIPFTPRFALDVGYHYEFRPLRLGGNRQMIYTYFRIRKPRT